MTESIFRNLGIYGWEQNEPVIVAALVAQLPIMIVGPQGACKTEAGRAIARGIYGDGVRFASYYCPNIHPEMITGPIDIRQYKAGKFDYLRTPISVWDKEVVLFDEPTRAPTAIQSSVLEFVRTRRWLDMPTATKLVMSASNPPELDHTTTYISLPLASRFVYVWAPSISRVMKSVDDFRDAVYADVGISNPIGQGTNSSRCMSFILDARDVNIEGVIDPEIMSSALKMIASELHTQGIQWSIRQAQYLRRMIEGLFRVYVYNRAVDYLNGDTLVKLVLSTCPEYFGVVPHNTATVSGDVDIPNVMHSIKNRISGFLEQIVDIKGSIRFSLAEMLKHLPTDNATAIDWCYSALDGIARSDAVSLHKSVPNAKALHKSRPNLVIPSDAMHTVASFWNLRQYATKNPSGRVSISNLNKIVNFGSFRFAKFPKSKPVGNRLSHRWSSLRSAQELWDVICTGTFINYFPRRGSISHNRKPGKFVFYCVDVTARQPNESDSSTKDRFVVLFGNSGNVALHSAVIFDPSRKDVDRRILLINWVVDSLGRVINPHIQYVSWKSYQQTGIRSFYLDGSDTITAVMMNPTWKMLDKTSVLEVLAHGIE